MDTIDLTRCRVLLVDDVKSNLDVLVEALQGHHLISIALDGESALKSIAHSPPDLVLLDLMMPRLDGYEVCRRLRADPATRELPVIFLSALGEAKSKARGFEAGGTDYIVKPFEAIEVRARVRSLLKGKVHHDTVRALRANELGVAREIQRGMVPTDFTSLCAGLPVGRPRRCSSRPKRSAAICYYRFLLGDGRICLVLGDVSEKGSPPRSSWRDDHHAGPRHRAPRARARGRTPSRTSTKSSRAATAPRCSSPSSARCSTVCAASSAGRAAVTRRRCWCDGARRRGSSTASPAR